jgi:hypothetical protein
MSSGYRDCSCPECFEIAIGEYDALGVLCRLCEEAGCDGEDACRVEPDEDVDA